MKHKSFTDATLATNRIHLALFYYLRDLFNDVTIQAHQIPLFQFFKQKIEDNSKNLEC